MAEELNWENANSLADLAKLTSSAKEAEKMLRTVTHTRKRDKFQHAVITVSALVATGCGCAMLYEYGKSKMHGGCNGTSGEVNSAF
jgi:hypothetical protein